MKPSRITNPTRISNRTPRVIAALELAQVVGGAIAIGGRDRPVSETAVMVNPLYEPAGVEATNPLFPDE